MSRSQLRAIEKRIARLEARNETEARANEASRTAEMLQAFGQQLEARLQAEGHWASPGEDFVKYVARGVGFDYAGLRQAHRSGLDELLAAIFERFPELATSWRSADDAGR